MEYSNPQVANNKKYYLIGLGVILFLTVIAVWFFWKQQGKEFSQTTPSYDYVIPGVPAINLFNHQGDLSYISFGDISASTTAVLEYWNPGENNFVEISNFFNTGKALINGDRIKQFIDNSYEGKYTFRREHLGVNELKKFINSETKTPLLFFFPLDKNQALEVSFHPLMILIGIKESEQKLVMHNYYLGNNYEMSFADFEKSWQRMRPDERDAYYVLQPVDLSSKLKEISSRKMDGYPARISVMDEFSGLLTDYAIGRAMNYTGNFYLALGYSQKAQNDPRFQDAIHPFYKMGIYYFLTNIYLKQGDLEAAKQTALLSVEADRDLNKPFNDWPGVEIRGNRLDNVGELSDPHRVLGDIYVQTNELDLAKQCYEKALEIKPNNTEASKGLELISNKSSTK